MATYLVARQPHFRDGALHPVGSLLNIASLENESGWKDYLVRQADPKPQTPEAEAAAAKAEVDALMLKLKDAQAKKAEADKKLAPPK